MCSFLLPYPHNNVLEIIHRAFPQCKWHTCKGTFVWVLFLRQSIHGEGSVRVNFRACLFRYRDTALERTTCCCAVRRRPVLIE